VGPPGREIVRGCRTRRTGAVRVGAVALLTTTSYFGQRLALAANDDTCPSRTAISQAIEVLVGRPLIEPGRITSEIEIREEGDRYSVSVRGRSRTFEDHEHDCARRARQTAVFVALTLSPPDFSMTETAPSPPVPAGSESHSSGAPIPSRSEDKPAAPAPRPSAVPQMLSKEASPSSEVSHARTEGIFQRFGVEVGVVGALPSAVHTPLFSVGPELTLRSSINHRWGLCAQGSLPTDTTLLLDELRVRQSRLPLSVMLTYGWRGEAGRAGVSVGPVVVPTRLSDNRLVNHHASTRIEGGVRVASTVAFGTLHFAPFLRVFVDLLPLRPEIAVEPNGVVGRTPGLWLGLVVGLDWESD
jgi:hypothetical protein